MSKPLLESVKNSQETLGYNSFEERKTKELLFAFVEPIGGGSKQIIELFKEKLKSPDFEYKINEITLSSLLTNEAIKNKFEAPDLPTSLSSIPKPSGQAIKISKLQQWGNCLREKKGFDFLAKKTIHEISSYRLKNKGIEKAKNGVPVPKSMKVVHIIRSIKHEDELRLLKSVYGDILFLIAVSGSREQQMNSFRPKETTKAADAQRKNEYEALSQIDLDEGIEHGQGVRDVFCQADLFLSSNEAAKSTTSQIDDFLNLIFGKTIKSPTAMERMMFEAFSASLRSTCLSRQVGAAISNEDNELISIGWNDVPAFGGGLASDEHKESCEALCKAKGHCRSSIEINKLLDTIYNQLRETKAILPETEKDDFCNTLKKAGISGLIEFSRAIHAEMEAILSAARTAKNGLNGGTIYVTTYPCENCVKHILAVGIKRLVYIEPYPKSRAKDFFEDFIVDDNGEPLPEDKLVFSQFTGISPQAYALLFKKWFERKDKSGNYKTRDGDILPVTSVYLDSYTLYEAQIVKELHNEKERATIPPN
ncbi:anti-phage dCTP deaminase [Maridesulfovibrio frigidus]|uniref:anti-phage dCTP deaminase n=1 Tax=Maridesulfovibrio frigidus TaxID=340956 RepID=UPI00055831A7|nr:anti-phage dCTP deaminase [Maridesulfovibrio frigidus]